MTKFKAWSGDESSLGKEIMIIVPLWQELFKWIVQYTLFFVCFSLADKTVIVWDLPRDETSYGTPRKSLTGHNHFVSDVVMSSDGQFALTGSWDKTLRLWDINT